MSHTNTPLPSITRELLALPEVNFAGISNALVLRLLPVDIQKQVRAATTVEDQIALAASFGDSDPLIQEMHHDLVVAPEARRKAGIRFAAFETVGQNCIEPAVLANPCA